MIHCVTSHVDLTSTNASGVHPNANRKRLEYLDMLNMMFSSFELSNPGSSKYVLTDNISAFEGIKESFGIVRTFFSSNTMMYDRMKAQSEFLETLPEGAQVCFLDTDILITKSISSMFNDGFDVAVTYRSTEDMPVNGGFFLVRNNPASRLFLKRCLEIYTNKYSQQKKWWGDQSSIADLIALNQAAYKENETVEVEGIKIKLLSCSIYNFTPSDKAVIRTEFTDKYVLHFKGMKKELMRPYWEMFMAHKYSKTPLALLRSFILKLKHTDRAQSFFKYLKHHFGSIILGFALAIRNISVKYRQNFASYLWAFIPPMVVTVAFTIANSAKILNSDSGGAPYPLFAFLGATLWGLTSDSLDGATQALTAAKSFITKVKFNRSSIVIAQIIEVAIQYAIRLIMVVGLLMFYSYRFSFESFAAHMLIATTILFSGIGVGLILAPVNILFQDFYNAFKIFLNYGMFVVPAVYNISIPGTLGSILNNNPLAQLIIGGRNVLLQQSDLSSNGMLLYFGGSLLLLLIGFKIYSKALPHVIDRLV